MFNSLNKLACSIYNIKLHHSFAAIQSNPIQSIQSNPIQSMDASNPCPTLVWRLGSVTARHSSSGREPNFAALNRGRHLYSAGRPSRWALAHISSFMIIMQVQHDFKRIRVWYDLFRIQTIHLRSLKLQVENLRVSEAKKLLQGSRDNDKLVMAALCDRGAIIFLPCSFFLLSSFYLFFPRLISAAVDWMSAILLHMACP